VLRDKKVVVVFVRFFRAPLHLAVSFKLLTVFPKSAFLMNLIFLKIVGYFIEM
jgi:hypothetical protein